MTPLGYITLHEFRDIVLENFLERSTDAGDDFRQIDRMIRRGNLQVFVERDGRIYRMPRDDAAEFNWIGVLTDAYGFLPDPTLDDKPEEGDYTEDRGHLQAYAGLRPLIKEEHVEILFPPKMPEPRRKSGAPGRPSSMDLVIAEHMRRDGVGETASTREAEAKWLEEWLPKAHPAEAPAKWKSILNKLPKSFQPNNRRHPK
jgi:hypothetical protein